MNALVEYEEVIEYEYEELLDDHLAFKWFEKAYNSKKTSVTVNNYALCFLFGIGVAKDIEKANEIFRKIGAKPSHDFCFIVEDVDLAESLKNYISVETRQSNDAQNEFSNLDAEQAAPHKSSSNEETKENNDEQTTTLNTQSNEEQTELHKNNSNEETKETNDEQTTTLNTQSNKEQTELHKNNSNEETKETNDEQTTNKNTQSNEEKTEPHKNSKTFKDTNHPEMSHSSFIDKTKAANSEGYLKEAAEAGDSDAMQILTVKYSTENDSENTYNYIKKMVSAGNCLVPIEYALNLYKLKKFEQAFNYFSMISKINNPIAKYFVAVMKYNGEGCKKDVEESYQILKNLSDNGIDRASEFLDDNF